MSLTDKEHSSESDPSPTYITRAIDSLEDELAAYHEEIDGIESFIEETEEITPQYATVQDRYAGFNNAEPKEQILDAYREFVMPDSYSNDHREDVIELKETLGFENFVYADMVDEFDLESHGDSIGMINAIRNNNINEIVKNSLIKRSERNIKLRKNVLDGIEEEIHTLNNYNQLCQDIDDKIQSIDNEISPSSINDAINLWPHIEITENQIEELLYERQEHIHSKNGLDPEQWEIFSEDEEFTLPVLEHLSEAQQQLDYVKNAKVDFAEVNPSDLS